MTLNIIKKRLKKLLEKQKLEQRQLKLVADSKQYQLFDGKSTTKMGDPKVDLPAELKKAETGNGFVSSSLGQMFYQLIISSI